MKKGRGKHKGSQFEREICARLSLWVSGGRRRDVFWRTATSGGRATVHKKRGEKLRQSGDIGAVAPEGHCLTDKFYFELKAYRDLKLARFLLECAGPLGTFWRSVCKEAESYGKFPVLIAKQDRLPILVITDGGNWLGSLTNAMDVGFLPSLLSNFATAEPAVVYKFDGLMAMEFRGEGIEKVPGRAPRPERKRIRGHA